MARFFQNIFKMMIRKVLFFLIIISSTIVVAQKPQRIGYIDMEYILENVPEYTDAQARLNVKVATWQQKLDGIKREIEVLKTDLSNEKPLLTQELISEREEDIQIKEEDLRKLQAAYFGPKGDLYLLRKQLVKPVQDQIYNAVQNIAVKKKYDLILDKSSDLILLYANKRFDVSELVLNSIVKGRKKVQLEDKNTQRQINADKSAENLQSKIDERAKKKEDQLAKIKAQQEVKSKLRAERIKANQERNKKRLEEIKNRNNKTTESNDKSLEIATDSINAKVTDSIQKTLTNTKDSIRVSKRAALLDRIEKQNAAKAKRKEELKKAAEEKRRKRLEEIEKRKNAKKQEKENNN